MLPTRCLHQLKITDHVIKLRRKQATHIQIKSVKKCNIQHNVKKTKLTNLTFSTAKHGTVAFRAYPYADQTFEFPEACHCSEFMGQAGQTQT